MPWLTPNNAPDDFMPFIIYLPVDSSDDIMVEHAGILLGALLDLLNPSNFQQYGSQTPEDTAQVFDTVIVLSLPWVSDV